MEFMSNRFSGSMGGCADGVPAQPKSSAAKSSTRVVRQQGETAGMAGSPDDFYPANTGKITQRSNDSTVDLTDSANMTEMQRVEATIKELVGRIVASKLGSSAHASSSSEPELQSVEVSPAKEHGLDNTEKGEYDPNFTRAYMDVPRMHKVSRGFVHDPHYYQMDVEPKSDENIIQLNGGKWLELCFPVQDPNSSTIQEPHNYYSPFPGQSQAQGQTDLHMRLCTNIVRLSFTMAGTPLTHTDFVNAYKPDSNSNGTIKITIPKEVIRNKLQDALSSLDPRTPYRQCTHTHTLTLLLHICLSTDAKAIVACFCQTSTCSTSS